MTQIPTESAKAMNEQSASGADAIDASEMTVIIPAFNEAGKIADVIRELRDSISNISIVVIDDGSNDSTGSVARDAGARVLIHRRNRGYGAALKTGIRAVSTPYVALYDADGQHRPEDLLKMMMSARCYDLVIGARDRNSPSQLDRRPGKWVLAHIAILLTGQKIPDLNSGLRILRRSVILRYLHLLPDGFSASTTTTICMIQRGYDVDFVPITTCKRIKGKSTVRKLHDGINTLRLMVRLIILFNPERFFLPSAMAMIMVGILYGIYKAIVNKQGIPSLAVLVIVTGLITGMFGLLANQISTLYIEMFEKDASEDRQD